MVRSKNKHTDWQDQGRCHVAGFFSGMPPVQKPHSASSLLLCSALLTCTSSLYQTVWPAPYGTTQRKCRWRCYLVTYVSPTLHTKRSLPGKYLCFCATNLQQQIQNLVCKFLNNPCILIYEVAKLMFWSLICIFSATQHRLYKKNK